MRYDRDNAMCTPNHLFFFLDTVAHFPTTRPTLANGKGVRVVCALPGSAFRVSWIDSWVLFFTLILDMYDPDGSAIKQNLLGSWVMAWGLPTPPVPENHSLNISKIGSFWLSHRDSEGYIFQQQLPGEYVDHNNAAYSTFWEEGRL